MDSIIHEVGAAPCTVGAAAAAAVGLATKAAQPATNMNFFAIARMTVTPQPICRS
jgi:hypothetical protein